MQLVSRLLHNMYGKRENEILITIDSSLSHSVDIRFRLRRLSRPRRQATFDLGVDQL